MYTAGVKECLSAGACFPCSLSWMKVPSMLACALKRLKLTAVAALIMLVKRSGRAKSYMSAFRAFHMKS